MSLNNTTSVTAQPLSGACDEMGEADLLGMLFNNAASADLAEAVATSLNNVAGYSSFLQHIKTLGMVERH